MSRLNIVGLSAGAMIGSRNLQTHRVAGRLFCGISPLRFERRSKCCCCGNGVCLRNDAWSLYHEVQLISSVVC